MLEICNYFSWTGAWTDMYSNELFPNSASGYHPSYPPPRIANTTQPNNSEQITLRISTFHFRFIPSVLVCTRACVCKREREVHQCYNSSVIWVYATRHDGTLPEYDVTSPGESAPPLAEKEQVRLGLRGSVASPPHFPTSSILFYPLICLLQIFIDPMIYLELVLAWNVKFSAQYNVLAVWIIFVMHNIFTSNLK